MEEPTTAVWQNALTTIEKQVTQGQFYALFKRSTLISLSETTAVIAGPNTMVVDLLRRQKDLITEALTAQLHHPITVDFTIGNPTVEKAKTPPEKSHDTLFDQQGDKGPSRIGHPPRVRPDYLFENFAVSSSNQLVFVSAQTVAANIGKTYNPFFIYGPVGVGKTHLMHAIANAVYHANPEKKILYLTSEEFTNEVVEAIRTQRTSEMKRKFRSVALLMLDDIQFIEGKEKVQEELFFTFNSLIDNGSQISFTSDRPPQEIKRIDDRLASRFASGLSVNIEPPDVELKTAILQLKAERFGSQVPTDVALFLADRAKDIRMLEGLLQRIISQATMSGRELSVDLARECFGELVQEQRGHLHAEDVIKTICAFYDVKPTQLRSPKRDAGLVRARQVAMYLLKLELGLTLVEIGNLLGRRDHTTVMHGVDKITELVDNKAAISQDIEGITKVLRG
jgi:chromosomal replication initiator protein